jgi:hypothetical protein
LIKNNPVFSPNQKLWGCCQALCVNVYPGSCASRRYSGPDKITTRRMCATKPSRTWCLCPTILIRR